MCRGSVNKTPGQDAASFVFRTAAGAQVVTNVLVQRLVERWWGPELRAAQLRDRGNALFHDGKVQDALRKYDEAMQLSK